MNATTSLWQSALVKTSQRFGVCSNRSPSSESPCDPIWCNSAQRGCTPTLGTRTSGTFVASSRTIWFRIRSTFRQRQGSTVCQPRQNPVSWLLLPAPDTALRRQRRAPGEWPDWCAKDDVTALEVDQPPTYACEPAN